MVKYDMIHFKCKIEMIFQKSFKVENTKRAIFILNILKMELFQMLCSSKVYFILPRQTFFQKYFDPHSFRQLSTEHVDALQTAESKEKRKRESWKSRKQRESKFSHMLMTLRCGKCVLRTHVSS